MHKMLLIRALREECAKEGFDLCDPIHTQWYNNLIEEEGHVSEGTLQKISEPPPIIEEDNNENVGDEGVRAADGIIKYQYNAVLIGNSKSVWPKFIHWLSSQYKKKIHAEEKKANDDLLNEEEMKVKVLEEVLTDNPFDTFVTETLSKVIRSCCSRSEGTREGSVASQLQVEALEFYWSNGVHYKVSLSLDQTSDRNDQEPTKNNNNDDYHCYVSESKTRDNKSFLVSMQRVAKITGKYWHDEEGTKLCVHPTFGTWKAFRAVVVFHKTRHPSTEPSVITTSIPQAPPMCPCPVDPEEVLKAKEILDYALLISGNDTSIGYKPSGKDDLCAYLHGSVQHGSDWSKVSATMRPWIQLRDCISVGRKSYKYCDNQLLYHYTKDPEILRNELDQKMSEC